MNLFYNPIVTYAPLLIKIFVDSYAITLKTFAGLCIVLSGITMYYFVYNVTNNKAISLFSAIIYLVCPYKLADIYKRFAIGEFTAFIFIPIVFTGLYNLFEQDGKKHYLISMGAIGLLLTHTLTTYYTAAFCAIYVLFNIQQLKNIAVIKKIIINVIFIILVCMFFWAPMYEAMKATDYTLFDNEIIGSNSEYVYDNTLELSEFFVDKKVELEVGEKTPTTYIIGIPIFVILCMTIFTYNKIEKIYKNLVIISIIFSIVSLYMCTKFCPWFLFPNFLCKLQYPWRMMGFFNFFASFICGVNIYIILNSLIKKDILKIIISFILIVILIVYTLPIGYKFKTDDLDFEKERENGLIEDPYISHMYINRDYLPVKALLLQRTYLEEKDYRTYILEGQAEIENEEIKDLTITFDLKNAVSNTVLEFPFFYYPGYVATISDKDGKEVRVKLSESENGFCSYTLNGDIEEAKIKVEYKGTIVLHSSYVVSAISFVIYIVYLVMERKRIKNEESD